MMGRIETNTDAAAAAKNTDLVVEAIVENLGIKKELFTALDAAAPKWVTQMNIGVGSAVGKVLDQKAKAYYWGVQFLGVAREFSPWASFQCRLILCLHSPCVQSHASASVYILRIPNIGSHTIVWTHENTVHTG